MLEQSTATLFSVNDTNGEEILDIPDKGEFVIDQWGNLHILHHPTTEEGSTMWIEEAPTDLTIIWER